VEQISSFSMPVLIKPAASMDSSPRCRAISLKGTTNKNFEGVAIGSFVLRIASLGCLIGKQPPMGERDYREQAPSAKFAKESVSKS
jgi:hypothetical protein